MRRNGKVPDLRNKGKTQKPIWDIWGAKAQRGFDSLSPYYFLLINTFKYNTLYYYTMKRLIIMMGPQGSGKTTICKKYYSDYFRISQDEQGREHKNIFDDAVKKGVERIVVDKTNPSIKSRARFVNLAKQHDYKIAIIWLDVERKKCKERILKRKNHETLLPSKADEALDQYFSRIEPPTAKEGDFIKRIRI